MPMGIGLVPLSQSEMYMYVTTPEPGNPRYPKAGLAAAMRASCRPHADWRRISLDRLPTMMRWSTSPWNGSSYWRLAQGPCGAVGRRRPCNDPHLGQRRWNGDRGQPCTCGGIGKDQRPESASERFCNRRFDRCKYIVEVERWATVKSARDR